MLKHSIQELYGENFKTLLKDIQEDWINEDIPWIG